jgi:hypothetical protein
MATDKQCEANRKNALRSTGPKTDAGKEQSKLNALKHGMRATNLEVLPNEDPEAYRARIDAWFDDYQPAGVAEGHLVRHAADLTWKIERVGRYETTMLSIRVGDAISQAEATNRNRVDDAFRKLITDAHDYTRDTPETADVARLRADIETSAEGCRRLIAAWMPLLDTIRAGGPWVGLQEMYAIRLASNEPVTAIRDPAIIDLAVASRMLAKPETPVTHRNWIDTSHTFFVMRCVEWACERRPAGLPEARALLIDVAMREIARLEGVLEERERDGDLILEDPEQAGRMATFDPSMHGDRLRRYQFSLNRELARTLEALAKLRRDEAKRRKDGANCANEANWEPGVESPGGTGGSSTSEEPLSVPGAAAPNEANSGVPVRASSPLVEIPPVPPGNPHSRNCANEANWSDRKKRKPADWLLAKARRTGK